MSDIVIKVETLSKQYRLGTVGTGTLSHDLNRWWARLRGKEDPTLAITESNDRTHSSHSDYVWALKDVDFEVRQGDILGIIGRNGAGKSTLLKILSRVTAPTTGSVKVKGRIASLLEVGTGFHPELTGRENIYLNGAILGMTRYEVSSKLDEIIDFSGCERFVDTPVKRYSSGMMVRLGFAVAAHLEPEILVVDEVLAVGDIEFQKKCLGKMKDVASCGRTVLFVSHNMVAVENLCHNALLMENGGLSDSGEVTQIITQYVSGKRKLLNTNLLQREDRTGGQKARIASVKLENPNCINSIRSGDPVKISLTVKAFTEVSYPLFYLSVYSVEGTKLLTLSNEFTQSLKKGMASGSHSVECVLQKLPLAKGEYVINVAIYSQNKLLDHLEHALSLDVFPGDFWGTGKMPSGLQGTFLVNQKWSYTE